VKPIVASAIDKRGEPLFPRTWKEDVTNRPSVRHQKQPSVNKEGMEAILKVVEEPYRLLLQLLAGCGPMRAGEALGLERTARLRCRNYCHHFGLLKIGDDRL
jgi:hypothetical protein